MIEICIILESFGYAIVGMWDQGALVSSILIQLRILREMAVGIKWYMVYFIFWCWDWLKEEGCGLESTWIVISGQDRFWLNKFGIVFVQLQTCHKSTFILKNLFHFFEKYFDRTQSRFPTYLISRENQTKRSSEKSEIDYITQLPFIFFFFFFSSYSKSDYQNI